MNITIRPYQPTDLSAAVALINHAANGDDLARTTPDTLLANFADVSCEPTTDCFVALTPSGEMVGVRAFYARMKKRDPIPILESTGATHPDYLTAGVLEALTTRLWQRCRAYAQSAGESGFIFQVRCDEDRTAEQARWHGLGLTLNRLLATMECNTLTPAPTITVPPAIALRPYRVAIDDAAWHAAYHDAFADHWGQMGMTFAQWQRTVQKADYRPDLHLVAWEQEQIAGFCYTKLSGASGSIRWLGVRPAWRRSGLGDVLTKAGLATLAQAGAKQVRLGVDLESVTGPARLYLRNGFTLIRRHLVLQRTFQTDL